MYYKESKKILEEIKKAKRIFLACHSKPDVDSILCNLLMKKVVTGLGVEADIYSIDKIRPDGTLEPYIEEVHNQIKIRDVNKVDLDKYDLLFALDVNFLNRLGFDPEPKFKGEVVNIDHHDNSGLGDIQIHDINAGATCTLLFYLFQDWGVNLSDDDLNKILIGILNDTSMLQYSVYESPLIFKTIASLIDKGADYRKAYYYNDQNYDLMVFKYYAEVTDRIEIDKKNKFVYAAIPYEISKKYTKYGVRSRWLADGMLRKIKGTHFGMSIMEDEKGNTNISIRSRTPGFYVLELVKSLGGGGHITGGGAGIKDLPFDKAVEKVLMIARKYAKANSKDSN